MDRVGIYQAKARLSELIERVERGEEVTITKNHKAVARIVPVRARARLAPKLTAGPPWRISASSPRPSDSRAG